jgi:hypothetical protein
LVESVSLKAPQSRRLTDPDAETVRRSHEEAIRTLQRMASTLSRSIEELAAIVAAGGGGGGGGGVPTSRLINTTSPLSGGGDLSADRTLTIATNSITGRGVVLTAPNDTAQFWRGDATWSALPTTIAPIEFLWGNGADGNLVYDGAATILGAVPSGNVYTLVADVCANDLTVNGGVAIRTNGYRIFVAGTASGSGTIQRNGNAGGNAVGSVAGAGATALGAGFFNGGVTGGAGGSGSAGGSSTVAPYGFTAAATAGSGINHAGINGLPGQGGTGGASGQGTGGVASTGSATSPVLTLQTAANGRLIDVPPACWTGRSVTNVLFTYGNGGTGGRTGSVSGSGIATDVGAGGGAGGSAGMLLFCARIHAGTLTITANGGNGGNGGNAFANNAGGGGGGGGGSGGVAVVVIGEGSLPTVTANGGTGGSAGAAHGTGGVGYVGGNGGAGLAIVYRAGS